MRFSELTGGDGTTIGQADPDITSITEDSRRVTLGTLFVAVPGTRLDGHDFVADAIRRGAAAIVAERSNGDLPVPLRLVPSSRSALARLAARFYDDPARDLHLIGFTGTFGKTGTSEVVRALLDVGGRHTGVVGSLGARYDRMHFRPSELTTPAPMDLHGVLRRLRDGGADTVVMEVTTHALRLGRIEGLRFADALIAAILPGEHTDFHRNYHDYVAAKRRLLEFLDTDAILAYDADNPAARAIASEAGSRTTAGLSLVGRPRQGPHDVAISDVVLDDRGASMTLHGRRLRSTLLGRANVRNVGLALTLALARGVDLGRAAAVLEGLRPLRRRLERLEIGGRLVIDDTAAHPASFAAAFEVADLIPRNRLIVAYAVRGHRGTYINWRNAQALAELSAMQFADALIVTAALDEVAAEDHPTTEEIDATKRAIGERGIDFAWHDTLATAMEDVARRSQPGDLIMLLGAQAMNRGAELLRAVLDRSR